MFFLIIFGFIILVILIFNLIAWMNKCPYCKKWSAIERISIRELSREGSYRDVLVKDEIKDLKGNVIGYNERKEQRHVERIEYEDFFKCKFCGQTFTDIRIVEV